MRQGMVAGLLKATCPGKYVKANLSHLYFSTSPNLHDFLSEAPFCFDLHQNSAALNFVAGKPNETSSYFKPSY